jgi:hypothetical protein
MDNRIRGRRPNDRHQLRLKAVYVDLKDDGMTWGTPSEVGREESKKIVTDLSSDYALRKDRIENAHMARTN